MSTRIFYSFGDSESTEPEGIECVCDYGDTVEEAVASNAKDKLDDEKDGSTNLSYWDGLKLFRVTIEEVPWTPAKGKSK